MATTTQTIRQLTIALACLSIPAACTGGHPMPQDDAVSSNGLARGADTLMSRLRSSTAPYRVLDSAVAAGYARNVAHCIENQPVGAMGYHHVNRALVDDRLEIERPEMLIYGRDGNGAYKLNGVEYIVPYRIRPATAEPPVVMGQALKRSDELRLWYLHVWVWEPNPHGVFADWNPAVRC